jgi:hypothetical protein
MCLQGSCFMYHECILQCRILHFGICNAIHWKAPHLDLQHSPTFNNWNHTNKPKKKKKTETILLSIANHGGSNLYRSSKTPLDDISVCCSIVQGLSPNLCNSQHCQGVRRWYFDRQSRPSLSANLFHRLHHKVRGRVFLHLMLPIRHTLATSSKILRHLSSPPNLNSTWGLKIRLRFIVWELASNGLAE